MQSLIIILVITILSFLTFSLQNLDFQKMKDQKKTRKFPAQVTNFVFISFKFCCCILIELQNFLRLKKVVPTINLKN